MKLEPGPGYRFLKPAERTQDGDECRDYDFHKWRPVPAGHLVFAGEGHLYRRRIEPPMQELVRASTAQMAIRYATFKLGDMLADGREVQSVRAMQRTSEPSWWQISYKCAHPGTYEMDSSMRVTRR